jgi:hypothetical protein
MEEEGSPETTSKSYHTLLFRHMPEDSALREISPEKCLEELKV